MTVRPRIAADVVAKIAQTAPGRVRKRFDKDPQVAEGWKWETEENGWTIDAGGETVKLRVSDGCIANMESVECSCLLAPRCFHLLACTSILEIDAGGADPSRDDEPSAITEEERSEELDADLPAEARECARETWNEAAHVLAAGAGACGALLQANLLRTIHQCRNRGLHRLAAGGLRIVQDIRLCRTDHDAFDSDALVADFAEMFETAWRLQQESAPAEAHWIGVARRKYAETPYLRVCGLFCEPLLTRSGYAGVVTYCVAEDGRFHTLSDVRPGDWSRVATAYRGGVNLADLSISHRDLCRMSLIIQNARVSDDFRLGSGRDCRAATRSSSGWSDETVRAAFARPLDAQVADVFSSLSLPAEIRPGGWDLLLLEGRILGAHDDALLLQLENGALLRLTAPLERIRSNMEHLAAAHGLAVRCVARLRPERAGEAALLAIAPGDFRGSDEEHDAAEESPRLELPESWSGVVNMGLEELQARYVVGAANAHGLELSQIKGDAENIDGLEPLRRRLRSIALSGRHSVPTTSMSDIAADSRRLDDQLQPTAAALIARLAQAASATVASNYGARFPSDPRPLAEYWLACAAYERAARLSVMREKWVGVAGESK